MPNHPARDLPRDALRRCARGAIDLAGVRGQTPVLLSVIEQAVGLHPHQALWQAGADTPPAIRRIMATLQRSGKILGGLALAEKRVYLDPELPHVRRRYVHGHEIGHKMLPWHEQAYWADDDTTLAPDARDQMEAEANAFSAELIFAGEHFTNHVAGFAPGIAVPLSMTGSYAVSAHAALRRYADVSPHKVALLALGRHAQVTAAGRALPIFRDQCESSSAFIDRYGPITQLLPSDRLPLGQHPVLQALHGAPAGTTVDDGGDLTLDTKRGAVTFHTDGFTNGRLNFVIVHRRNAASGRRLRIVS